MEKIILAFLCFTLIMQAEEQNEINVKATPDFQSIVQKTVTTYSKEMNNTAVLLLIEKQGKTYKASAGLADRVQKRSIKTDALFEIGSATKVFTGIAIFQLIESEKLSLDTKLNALYKKGEIRQLANFKGKSYWDDVTIQMLLEHTSGFIDYLNIYGNDNKAIKLLGGRDKHFTFNQLIADAVGFGDANFKPGEKYKYSNTGYVILGDIISKVSGMDWHDYMQKNILDKVGMENTYFGTRITKKLREKMPRGYMHFKEVYMAPSLATSAGEIISNLDDLALLMKAWSTGKLYTKPDTLTIQLTKGFHKQSESIVNLTYGNAIMQISGFYGHGGQTFGFQSYMTINPKSGDMYIVGINDSSVGSMELFMLLSGIRLKR